MITAMDKNAIKKYAVWARTELITRVSQRAEKYDITAEADANASSVNGVLISEAEKKQRKALIEQVKQKGFDQVIEEVAYTWFNRFIALRFMEVNGYLPSHIRVFTDDNNNFKPQILAEAIHLELDGLDMEKVYEMKNNNENDELYKYLIMVQCNNLNKVLPGIFQKIFDYTELLFPDNILRDGSVIEQMISIIPENDWNDQVQIIGWLYQYYIAEPKDELINARKQYQNKDIPFVTQLFTSDWIVRFIVQNSLGRAWIESHPDSELKNKWEFYLDNNSKSLMESEIKVLSPDQLTCIDPCAGSGHILAYAFDVLMDIYLEYGFTVREAVASIVENNIHGLDIDERAVQLANFEIMMKGCQYDRRFLQREISPNIYSIHESNMLDSNCVDYFCDGDDSVRREMTKLIDQFHNAKIYGSVITSKGIDFDVLNHRITEIQDDINMNKDLALGTIRPLIRSAELLSKQYYAVFTNPPYMATRYMPDALKKYVSDNYSDYKSDLFAAFIVRCREMCLPHGCLGFLTPYVWMFIQSYEMLRDYVYKHMTFSSLVQLEYNAFEAACVPVAAFTLRNYKADVPFECVKLSDFKGADVQAPKTLFAVKNPDCGYRYTAKQEDFLKIPGHPVAYWASQSFIESFDKGISIDTISDFTGSQHITADNDRFLRYSWELPRNLIDNGDWKFYAKGGEFRKWYGNIDLVVDWTPSALDFYAQNKTSNLLGEQYRGKEGITYTELTSSINTFRYLPEGCIFDKKGPSIVNVKHLYYCLAIFCTPIAPYYFAIFNPSISTQVRDVKNFPIIIDDEKDVQITSLAKENVEICREDWNLKETSWDYRGNPLCRGTRLEDSYEIYKEECLGRFNRLKENEETINKLFIGIYNLQNELDYKVPDEQVSVRLADRERDVKELISYAVGCMFGRYSLDVSGVAYAGGEFENSKYTKFSYDRDGIIPICDDDYFEDDITGLFIKFISKVFGEEYLEDNLKFIADSLSDKGNARDIIRNYFLNDFYNDHVKMYQKRPIYWLFDSGRKNGFKCLVYIHRYQADTVARIRTDYVHEQQSRYQTAIEEIGNRLLIVNGSEKVKVSKQLKKLQEQAEEIHKYEEKVHHIADKMISLDMRDGVKANYAKLQDVLAKIK